MEYEIKPKQKLNLNLKELWEYKELFYFFTWRDVKVKYKQTFLGALWAVLQPLLMMLVFTFVFQGNFKINTGNSSYPVFVYSGLLLWNIFNSGISNSGNSMVSHANIIKKIYFPRLIIPISAILSSLIDFIIAFVIFIFLLGGYHQLGQLPNLILHLPLALLITFFSTCGLGCLLSALNIKYRDFRYIIPFMMQILFFASPIIYPVSNFSNPWIKKLLALNPISGAIEYFRSVLTGIPYDPILVSYSFASSLFFLIIGLVYFRRTENYFADIA